MLRVEVEACPYSCSGKGSCQSVNQVFDGVCVVCVYAHTHMSTFKRVCVCVFMSDRDKRREKERACVYLHTNVCGVFLLVFV